MSALPARGRLYLCLGQNDKIDLMPCCVSFRKTMHRYALHALDAMAIKPKGHDFDLSRAAPAVVRFMSMTGG